MFDRRPCSPDRLDSQATPFSLIGRGWEKKDWLASLLIAMMVDLSKVERSYKLSYYQSNSLAVGGVLLFADHSLLIFCAL